jgi:hypothetical protein
VLGTLAVALIGAWVFGGIVLRLAGGLLGLAGLIGLSLSGNANGLLVFVLGACLWLAGHLHFRLRHGAFKSALVKRLVCGAVSRWPYGSAIARSSRAAVITKAANRDG